MDYDLMLLKTFSKVTSKFNGYLFIIHTNNFFRLFRLSNNSVDTRDSSHTPRFPDG